MEFRNCGIVKREGKREGGEGRTEGGEGAREKGKEEEREKRRKEGKKGGREWDGGGRERGHAIFKEFVNLKELWNFGFVEL